MYCHVISVVTCTHNRTIERQRYPAPRSRFMWWLLRRSTMRRQYLPSSYALRVRDRCSLFVYVKRGELSLMNNTSYKKYTDGFPKKQKAPHIRAPLDTRSVGLAGQPGIPPTAAPPEASYRRPEDIIVLSRLPSIPCTISHKTCQQLPYNKRHPILGCLLTRDPWVLPAKPDIPPTAAPPLPPHLKG